MGARNGYQGASWIADELFFCFVPKIRDEFDVITRAHSFFDSFLPTAKKPKAIDALYENIIQ